MTAESSSTDSLNRDLIWRAGPVLIFSIGIVASIFWHAIASGPFLTAPPLILAQIVLTLAALRVVLGGVPPWAYVWLAFGIVSALQLLNALVAAADVSVEAEATAGAILALAGLLSALLTAIFLAERGWSETLAFLGLYLASVGLGFPRVYSSEADLGWVGVLGILLLVFQATLLVRVLLGWGKGRVVEPVVLLLVLLLLSPAAEVSLLQMAEAPILEESSALGLFRAAILLYIVCAMLTFIGGALWRLLRGKRVLGEGAMGDAIDQE